MSDTKDTKTIVNCVVCLKDKMQIAQESKIPTISKMIKKLRVTPWNGKTIYCWLFEAPKDPYDNKFATAIMGTPIRGNAIICSVKGMDIDEIEDYMTDRPATSWASLARQLPKVVKLETKVEPQYEPQDNENEEDEPYFAEQEEPEDDDRDH